MTANPRPEKITGPLYGIWFLNPDTYGYSVVSRNGDYGELFAAPVLLPDDAPSGKPGTTPAEAVLNEIGTSITHTAFQQLAHDPSPLLRSLGIRGLIEADDPQGVKLAASGWDEISGSADIQPIIGALMGYSNDADSGAVRALGSLALRDAAGAQLRQNASMRCGRSTRKMLCRRSGRCSKQMTSESESTPFPACACLCATRPPLPWRPWLQWRGCNRGRLRRSSIRRRRATASWAARPAIPAISSLSSATGARGGGSTKMRSTQTEPHATRSPAK